uniref:Uncharacterized protein n=1 Tax=Timema cristinae TaxID=61476 RepID=A0A7R9H718_TIMCR|nr:unnamed protein product [Timema cristinae]
MSGEKADLKKDNAVDTVNKESEDDSPQSRGGRRNVGKRVSTIARTAQEGEAILKVSASSIRQGLGHKEEGGGTEVENRRRTRSSTRGVAPTPPPPAKREKRTPPTGGRGTPVILQLLHANQPDKECIVESGSPVPLLFHILLLVTVARNAQQVFKNVIPQTTSVLAECSRRGRPKKDEEEKAESEEQDAVSSNESNDKGSSKAGPEPQEKKAAEESSKMEVDDEEDDKEEKKKVNSDEVTEDKTAPAPDKPEEKVEPSATSNEVTSKPSGDSAPVTPKKLEAVVDKEAEKVSSPAAPENNGTESAEEVPREEEAKEKSVVAKSDAPATEEKNTAADKQQSAQPAAAETPTNAEAAAAEPQVANSARKKHRWFGQEVATGEMCSFLAGTSTPSFCSNGGLCPNYFCYRSLDTAHGLTISHPITIVFHSRLATECGCSGRLLAALRGRY